MISLEALQYLRDLELSNIRAGRHNKNLHKMSDNERKELESHVYYIKKEKHDNLWCEIFRLGLYDKSVGIKNVKKSYKSK